MWIDVADHGVLIDTGKAWRILKHDAPISENMPEHFDYMIIFETIDGNERDLYFISEDLRNSFYNALSGCLMSGDNLGTIYGKFLKQTT